VNKNKVLIKTDKVVMREIEGEVILLPLYKTSKDMNYIYTLNDTASEVWDRIDGKHSIEEIKKDILDDYEIDEKHLTEQMDMLIKDLQSIKAVK
jgi:hypothetical protein